MKNNRYKILVLSDLKNATSTTLKSTVSLAKMINGDIVFFHVKKPIEVVEKENQLSAIRTINEKQNVVKKEIQNLVTSFSNDYGVKINFTFTFGNVKNEIDKQIKAYQPDIIVLGKRKSKLFNFIGDKMTNFILKKYDGTVMLASDHNALDPNNTLSMGVLNKEKQAFNTEELTENLIKHTQKPVRVFKMVSDSTVSKKTDDKAIEYVFEGSDNTVKNLSNHLTKNNINLLCVDREHKTTLVKSSIKDLNVSLLLIGKQKV